MSTKRRYKRRNTAPLIAAILILGILLAAAGGWLWYDANVDRSGWFEKDGRIYYADFHGTPLAGWLEIEGKRYFFGADGAMVTGWQEILGTRYYFGQDGAIASGWTQIDGSNYFLTPDGTTVAGWQGIDGERYYFSQEGTPLTGWQQLDGNRYYFDGTGAMVTGSLALEDGTRLLGEDGILITGMYQMEDGLYCFDEDGLEFHGWAELPQGRCYFTEDGPMALGWQEIGGKRYHFDEAGAMQTGWFTEGEYRYYLQEDGSAAVSPTEIDGTMCFFTPKGIYVLLVNNQYPIPQGYDPELLRFGNSWSRVCTVAYEPLERMINDCKAAGINCWLNCAYRTNAEQTQILEERTEEYTSQGMTWNQARAKALETVAVPGYSEHQVGLAMDIVCNQLTDWLIEHCWEYGFILRYPEGKQDITGIAYEHWHFRYVGVEVSMDMKDTGLCLEEYLGAA